ncbi:MAG TPA: glycosyltransferase [Methylomirabilota bacterium]|jgi:glycosyltransferase involved in cell wall biosynthesis|nr:glycosyltransferase [Methylomirabilota bacterium]
MPSVAGGAPAGVAGPAPARRLRVLQVYPKGDFHTGAAIQLRDLARGLAGRGHRVLVLTRPSERWAAEAQAGGFRHLGWFPGAADPVGAIRLARLLRRDAVEVVHAHKGAGRTLTLLARVVGPRPPLVVNRGVSFPMGRASRWLDGSRWIACIVAVCAAIRDDLVRQGLPADKIEVVYSGTDTTRFDPARVSGAAVRAALALPPGAPLVTQIGVREPKGNDDLLRAFARIRAERPDARLLLVGARPEKRAPLEALARALGLDAAVTLWGYRDDVPEILAASAVSVDASHEGLGITGALRESLAMETPVVATRLMGNPELIRDGEHGLLVPPRDPVALAAAVVRLLADPAWARTLGRAGRRRVVEGFSTDAKLDRLEALYARLAARVP